jgi:hypothetical protein
MNANCQQPLVIPRFAESWWLILGVKEAHKIFESANIKIDSVVSDLFGVTGRNLMQLLVEERKALTLSDIQGCVRGYTQREGGGTISIHLRLFYRSSPFKTILETIAMPEAQIEVLEHEICRVMKGHEPLLDRMKAFLQRIVGALVATTNIIITIQEVVHSNQLLQ